jgi:putative membrane protein
MTGGTKRFLGSWAINTLAVLVATQIVKGIHYQKPLDLFVASLVLGILNAVLRPILLLLALPLLVLTLGVFLLVLNALVLYFVGYLLRPHFYVMDFWSAFWGALTISVVTIVLNSLTGMGNARIKVERRGPNAKPPDRNDVIDV